MKHPIPVTLTKRNKKRFEAQQILMRLRSLAHPVIIWTRGWLTPSLPRLHHFGVMRLVRDVFHISGFLVTDVLGQMIQLVLNRAAPLASLLVDPLRELLAPAHIVVCLGET